MDKKYDRIIGEGLNFSDVLIVPNKSNVEFNNISLKTYLTNEVVLNVPLMSAPTNAELQTITESDMAVAIARQGGIGIVHCNMSIESQALEIDKVKRSQHGVISDPFYLSPNHYVREALELMGRYKISGVPICEGKKLVGIITNRDVKFENNCERKIYELMTSHNLVTAPEGTSLEEAKKILAQHKIEKLPLIDSEGNLQGLITIKDIEKAIKYPNAAHDKKGRLLVGAMVLCNDESLLRCGKLVESHVDVVVLESEYKYSYSDRFINMVREIKSNFKNLQLIAGNVVTPDAVKELILAGADAIKIGIGSATNSDININSGVGVPQLSAILDCVHEAHKYGIPVVADGGIRYSGDLTKAIAAGANVCMLGSIFLNCYINEERMESRRNNNYRTLRKNIPLRALYGDLKLSEIIKYLSNGLKLGMYYCGAKNIDELQKCKFVKSRGRN